MQRMGMMIRLRPNKVAEYKALHATVPDDVLACLAACHIHNYTIFIKEPENLLFGYWEYAGTDFAADMARMEADPATRRWWALTGPCQLPLATRAPDEWWAAMTEIFHFAGGYLAPPGATVQGWAFSSSS
jgi:L-rhamnose mutarotase